ncbi:MAG: nitroreductase [Euryarchaeota archaeon]|nr:nitroreductase [Euryarchaeota archaeon]
MTVNDLYPFIFRRKSIRKFLPGPLDESELSSIRSFMDVVKPLHPEIRTEMRMIEAKDLRGLLRTDAPYNITFCSEPKEGYLANAGFMLQQVDLFLSANGFGNCYQGMAKPVKGIVPPPGLEFVISTSFGRPAVELHRGSVAEFNRKAIDMISTVNGMDDIMEAARLAPSGVNNQSWFFTGGEGKIHSYFRRSLIGENMNQINVGIALCHIWIAAEHSGRKVEFADVEEGYASAPSRYSYIITVKVS